MASSVIHATRHTGDDDSQSAHGRRYPSSNCRPADPSREKFVIRFQRLRDETLPEFERLERMLTRLVIAHGLEYCLLEAITKSFLGLSRNARRLQAEMRRSVLRDERSSPQLAAVQHDTSLSLEQFRDAIANDVASPSGTLIYRRLLTTLIEFEAKMSKVLEVQASEGTPLLQS